MVEKKLTLFGKLKLKKAEQQEEKPGFFRRYWSKILIAFLTISILTFFHVYRFGEENDFSNTFVQIGSIWPHKTLVADYSFPIYKSRNQYTKDVERAKDRVVPVFINEPERLQNTINKIDSIYKVLSDNNYSLNIVEEIFAPTNFQTFFASITPEKIKEMQRLITTLKRFISNMAPKGISSVDLGNLKSEEIAVVSRQSNIERIIPKRYIYDKNRLINELSSYLRNNFKNGLPEIGLELVNKSLNSSLIFSQELTENKIRLAEQSVPRTIGFVKSGEIIVEKGKKITEDILLKINSYEKVKLLGSKETFSFWMLFGSFLNIFFIYAIILIYLVILRKRIFADDWQFAIINFCLLLIGFFSWLSISVTSDLPLRYIIFLPSLSLLIAIVFDSRTAFYSTVTMACIVASIRGNDFETALTLMFAGVIGAYSVRDIQSRTQMFRSMVYIEIAFVVPIVAFALQRSTELKSFFESLSFVTLNSILSPIITYGILFLLERYSNITSDLKLKEFDNLNHPLLKRLSEVAPGTYQHTLSMAMLAEMCAEEIGANRLLTRVGAYFHDVGKLYKPEYFSENQMDIENKHEFISPKRSAEVIREHVTKGIEIAKEYGLPPRIIDFIPMHHGTSLIKHFYAKAVEEGAGFPIDQTDFRYPGPKPNSKETVIVMICDSAEAMSRLPKKNKEELTKAIQKSIQDKLLDGQFDESNISMKELNTILEVCVRHLYGIAHPRVEYKEIPPNFTQSSQ